MLPYSNNCRNFHDSHESIRLISLSIFFFVTLSSSSRAAIAEPIGEVYFPFFKMLDPRSDSTSADARFSIYTYIKAMREYTVEEFPS
jgi:hypothetical protein